MDFFENQYTAKRNSKFLYAMFFLVVLAFQLSISLVVGFFTDADTIVGMLTHRWSVIAGGIGTLIYIVGCFIEWRRLAGGGKAIAKRLHAKPLYRIKVKDAYNHGQKHGKEDTLEFSKDEKNLLEIVAHMSIASGVTAPHVFVLPNEQGINAFVAGTTERDTVLVVTEGAITNLTDNELYALVGHEFSHIAHGDTKQNMILLILMGGFLAFLSLGVEIIDYTSDDDSYDYDEDDDVYFYRSKSDQKQDVSWDFIVFIIGTLVMSFSFIGIVFARLFKYAFLRQREYLADASSVQYTRSHDLVSVLSKVKDFPKHGGVYEQNIETFSHLFFANAVPESQFSSLLSTHPPIDKRIKAISESQYHIIKRREQALADRDARLKKYDDRDEATKKREAIAEARRANQFEYREKSDYDGTPLEFNHSAGLASGQAMGGLATANLASNKRLVETTSLKQSKNNANPKTDVDTQPNIQVVPALQKLEDNQSLEIAEKNADLIDSLIDVMSTPKGCLEMIAAALACHQQTDISPLDYEVSVKLYELLQKNDRDDDIPALFHALDTLAQKSFRIDATAAKLYLNRLTHIIHIDGKQTLLEQLLIDRIAYQIGLVPNIDTKNQTNEPEIAFAFTMLANAFLVHDNHDKNNRIAILKRMQNLINIDTTAWQQMASSRLSISECLNKLATSSASLRRNLYHTLETTMLADGNLCQDEKHMLVLLNWRLNIVTSAVR